MQGFLFDPYGVGVFFGGRGFCPEFHTGLLYLTPLGLLRELDSCAGRNGKVGGEGLCLRMCEPSNTNPRFVNQGLTLEE